MVVRAAALLAARPRVAAALAVFAALVAWYFVYSRLPDLPTGADVAVVGGALIPATFVLVWLALPLRHARGLFPVAVALALLAAVWEVADFEVAANFAKLGAVLAVAFWFLTYFEKLSWVVAIAAVIPLVDAVSVWRGPTHHIVTERPRVFTTLSYAVPVPEGVFALGLPDVLFFALFLGAAARWGLRIAATWGLMILSFGVTMVLAIWVDPFGIGGVPALPGLSIAFLLTNGDLLWRRLRARERPGVAVAGVDACPGGWAVAVWRPDGTIELSRVASFAETLPLDVAVIAVDIPVGAPEIPPRPADVEARAFVGPRASSVFPTPPLAVLDAPDYQEALRRHRELTGAGLSKQAFFLCRRMLEVEPHAAGDERIVEVHPEVSFRALAGRPLSHSKHAPEGLEERRRLLEERGITLPTPPTGVPLADALDAAVAAWTAARYARGEALALPEGHTERTGAIWR